MKNSDPLAILKTKLQSLGALQPAAWYRIIQLHQQTSLKVNESFIRREGTLAYIAEGLLKEYDAQNRISPSIINFITAHQCVVTRKHNQKHYLKASMPSLVYYWDFEELTLLYADFPELKIIHHSLVERYDNSISLRTLILEKSALSQKIMLFINQHKNILHLLKKKDMANYLNVDYDYFIRYYSKLL